MMINIENGIYMADTEIRAILKTDIVPVEQVIEAFGEGRKSVWLVNAQEVKSAIITKECVFFSGIKPETVHEKMKRKDERE